MERNTKYIFISYSRKDRRIVNKVVSLLRDKGFDVWIDTTGIESGEQFKHKIVNAIEGCEVFLYFASKNSNISPWTAKEIGIATSLNKRIIPIRLDHSPFNKEVLFDIVNINYIDLSDTKLKSNNLAILISTLTSILPLERETETDRQEDNLSNLKRRTTLKTFMHFLKSQCINVTEKISAFLKLSFKLKIEQIHRTFFNALKSKRFWLVLVACVIFICIVFGLHRISIYVKYACTTERQYVSYAKLGDILAHDGRKLATSESKYDIYIDCTITDQMHLYNKMSWRDKYIIGLARRAGIEMKLENAYKYNWIVGQMNNIEGQDRSSIETFNILDSLYVSGNHDRNIELAWQHDAEALSKELSTLLLEKSAAEYFQQLVDARYKYKKRFVPICKAVDKVICDTISRMPILRKGQFAGGLIVQEHDSRLYPYGDLARRVLGYCHGNFKVGIDGQLDSIVKGRDGEKWTKYVNVAGWKKEKVIRERPKFDGADVRTTLAIPIQQVVDKVLREYISQDTTIYGGTVTIMDVKTGAIRAMANIEHRAHENTAPVGEYYNLALGYRFEPGTILGAASLISFLEGYGHMYESVKHPVDSMFPFETAINRIKSLGNAYYQDNYQFVHSLIHDTKTSSISAMEGVSQSNPYVLAGLSFSNYGNLEGYLDLLNDLLLIEDIQFDIKEDGGGKPRVAKPKVTDDYNYFLASLGCGYGIAMTPLQILTFYNVIANKGVKVKPYIIESIEQNSQNVYRHTPVDEGIVLDENIISQVDTIMRYAAVSGNCGICGLAKDNMAAISGHALYYFGPWLRSGSTDGYVSSDGESRWNSSCVGYFPVDNPQYSIICTIVTYKTDKQYPGNDIPAKIVSDIYNNL